MAGRRRGHCERRWTEVKEGRAGVTGRKADVMVGIEGWSSPTRRPLGRGGDEGRVFKCEGAKGINQGESKEVLQ